MELESDKTGSEPTNIEYNLPFHQIIAPNQGDKCRCGWFATHLGLIMHEYAQSHSDLTGLNLKDELNQWIEKQKSTYPRISPFQTTLQKYCAINPENNTKIHSKNIKNLIAMHFNIRGFRIPENISILEKDSSEGSSVACIRKNIANFKNKKQSQLIIIYSSRIGHWAACILTVEGIWIADSYYQPIRINSSLFRNIERVYRAFHNTNIQNAGRLAKELE